MKPILRDTSRTEHLQPPAFERVFGILLTLCGVAGTLCGLYLMTVKPTIPARLAALGQPSTTHFIIPEPQQPPQEKPVVKKTSVKPVDLTTKPQLAQPAEQPKAEPQQKPVRKVYGLRRVYSTGLGSGSSMSDAVIGKLGNTLNKEFDTLTASQQEIRGEVVSATTVTSAPKFKKQVRPQYSPEMLDNRVEGVVKVKVLVDIDGKVKKATALNDLGFQAARRALDASLAMEFFPALRGSQPVAVWIIIPIRFLMLG